MVTSRQNIQLYSTRKHVGLIYLPFLEGFFSRKLALWKVQLNVNTILSNLIITSP